MNVEYYTEKYYYNKDWGNGWTSIFNEREEHEDYRWTAVSEDGWAQATPNNYLKHGDYDSLNKMTAMTRGFFVAPQSGCRRRDDVMFEGLMSTSRTHQGGV